MRRGYLVASLILIAVYPVLPAAGRNTVLLLASLAAIPALLVGLRRISPSHRRFWLLLLAGLVATDLANLIALASRGTAVSVNGLVDAAGNLLMLAAALVLVMQHDRGNLGRVIDTTIVALAVGGLLWDVVLQPNLLPDYQTGSAKLAVCVVVFSLCGVLGALAELVVLRRVAALPPLITALALALVGDIVIAVTTDPRLTTAAGMMFVGAYTAIGLFGLDPTAAELVTPPAARPDRLSLGRLVFLGVAVAIVPIIVSGRQIAGGNHDGLVLMVSSAAITTLVMMRITQLSAQRDEALRALTHEATHDALTGLPNRKKFVTELAEALSTHQRCAVVFCDLDRFKAVNDRFGHANGDQVLIEVAQRLRACVRAHDVVSRFGGDEFVILVHDATPHEVQTINRRVIHALSRPVPVSDQLVTIGASTGTAHAANDTDPEELINRADHAMYTAKANGT